jgi:hypothetical protein
MKEVNLVLKEGRILLYKQSGNQIYQPVQKLVLRCLFVNQLKFNLLKVTDNTFEIGLYS